MNRELFNDKMQTIQELCYNYLFTKKTRNVAVIS